MTDKTINLLMIGPGATENISGGVVTVIDNLIDTLDNRFNVIRIVTMRPIGILLRLTIYMKAFYLIVYNWKKNNLKVAHVHMASRNSFYRKSILIILLKFLRIPILLHLHGGGFHIFFNESSKIQQTYIKWIFNLVDITVVLSNSWKSWYEKTIDKGPSKVIYNGVKNYKLIDTLPLNKRNPVILFLGKVGVEKGIEDLLYAFYSIIKSIPNVILKIGGNGALKETIKLVNKLGLENNVELLGWVNEDQKYKLLNEVQVYILPSYNEGLPMGILEAMSTGLVVISTNVGGIPEVIENNYNGLLIEPGKKEQITKTVISILNNKEKMLYLSKNAQKSFNKYFDSKIMTKKFEDTYYEIL